MWCALGAPVAGGEGEDSGYLHGWPTIRGCPGQQPATGEGRPPAQARAAVGLWGWGAGGLVGAANTFENKRGR